MCMLTLPICFLTDIQGNKTGASVNNLIFNQPFLNPEPKIPPKFLPGMVYLLVSYIFHTIPRLITSQSSMEQTGVVMQP